ncbi:MAG: VanW family protein [Nocardioides sp.]
MSSQLKTKQKPPRDSENSGGRVVVLTVLGLAVLSGVAYVAAYAFAGEKVPRGTEVAGIAIGGKTHDDAVRALEDGFADREALDVTVEGETAPLTAATAGLSVDVESSVDKAGGGRSWSPGRLWDYYAGGGDLDPVVVVDQDAQAAALKTLDETYGSPAKEGDVRFKGGEARTVAGTDGQQVDRQTAADALEAAYVDGATAELTLEKAEPDISQADVQDALNEFANPAVSGPVTLVFDKTRVTLRPADFSPALGMKPEDGKLVADLDEDKLAKLVRSRFARTDGAPVDATVRLVNGKPQVVPAKPGVDYDPKDISSAFLELVVKDPGERQMKVKATVKDADFTTKDARALGIKERVSTFTTYYPYAEYRNINLGRAAELVNGTVLKPGETFSLNDTVGERTAENGFTKGFIISDGVFKEDFGGGVSQMATTTFNAMFFAGLEDVEHKPHSFYIDRYPVGREATVAWGAVDLRFKNDTDHGVLVQAHVTPSTPSSSGVVTVSMWSTKTWDITTKTGNRYNFTPEKTRRLSGPECEPNDGYGGFDINVWRYFRKPGASALERTEKFHTTYTPSDTVICVPEKRTTPPSEDAGD